MIIRSVIIIFLFSVSLVAQDSTKEGNIWFTEFQIANSRGFTVNFIDGANLSVGRRMTKNIDLRLNLGFNTRNYDTEESSGEYNSESSYNRFNAGLDILHRIQIVKDLLFKIGVGYEYSYSMDKNESEYNEEIIIENSNVRTFGNIFKLISSFIYNFTNNIYAFVQGNILYERFNTKNKFSSTGIIQTRREQNSNSSNFKLGNFILGGGISF